MRLGLTAVAMLAMGAPAAAAALEGERETSLAIVAGPSELADPAAGAAVGIDAQWLWHTSDFWAFGGGVRGRGWSGPEGGASVEGIARWTLDALQWIPSLAVAMGYQTDPWQRVGAVLRLEGSLAWRRERGRAWVFRIQAESPRAGHLEPARALIGVGLVWYAGKTSGFEL
ncbi:MAG: hypothetical protein FJ100_15915 [Deltaproteobacteria bacterium]|nr:hypothetical protein [Deltaproteobacteria bacterium]